MKKVLLFPGQGSQSIGMGADLSKTYSAAREVFQEVDDALSFNLSSLMWSGDIETLTQTQNAQPALMAVSVAVWKVLQSKGYHLEDFSYVAGHSLGEYTALCVAEALPLAETARLLHKRGEAMAKAAQKNQGGMAAIIGLDIAEVEKCTQKAGCFIANDNSVGQVVISGNKDSLLQACDHAKSLGARRAIPLNVAGAFHSPLMQDASDEMKDILPNVAFKNPIVPVVLNVTASASVDAEEIKGMLLKQITGQVRWRETIRFFKENNVETAFELGAGKVLAGLVRKTEPDISVYSIGDVSSIEELENL